MDAVREEMNAFAEVGLRFIMEHEPVQQVFGQGPCEETTEKERDKVYPRQLRIDTSPVKEIPYNGNIDNQWHGEMHVREEFQEAALEEPC